MFYYFLSDKNGRNSPNYQLTFPAYKSFSPPSHIPVATNTIPQSVAFPELNLLTLEELQFLNESADRQNEFLENLPPMREMNKTVDDLMVQIEELAGNNFVKLSFSGIFNKIVFQINFFKKE